ncbi:protein Aster-B [Caerostris extrusa]|uniref:Protein Aster-B n=1 Tax=Caerostris extrusa TaxID=172846 RepID=A0AAV4NQN8_CAEEX|nr:protein Aster-B [Caerostris extrusa]
MCFTKDILVHGRLYVSQNYICFYANIFRWETFLLIRCRDVTSMTKEKTARVIPNAIQITTETEKHFFTSFGARDKTFLMLFRIWQNALIEQPMSSQELWQWVHFSYGDELGLTSDDDDYVAPPIPEEDMKSIKHSDQNIVKYVEKSYEKGDSTNLQESANEFLIADENSESANGMDRNSDPPAYQDIEEEVSQQNDSKCGLNQNCLRIQQT